VQLGHPSVRVTSTRAAQDGIPRGADGHRCAKPQRCTRTCERAQARPSRRSHAVRCQQRQYTMCTASAGVPPVTAKWSCQRRVHALHARRAGGAAAGALRSTPQGVGTPRLRAPGRAEAAVALWCGAGGGGAADPQGCLPVASRSADAGLHPARCVFCGASRRAADAGAGPSGAAAAQRAVAMCANACAGTCARAASQLALSRATGGHADACARAPLQPRAG
jgi:hypothetical protein